MLNQKFTSVEEIVEVYDAHLESLKTCGIEFDEYAVLKAKAEAIALFSLGE